MTPSGSRAFSTSDPGNNPASTLADVLITDKLATRPQRLPQVQAENAALRNLARMMATTPDELPDALLETAMKLCHAGSAGISVLQSENGEEIFRWTNLVGAYKLFIGGTTPRKASPCGVTMDKGAPQLFSFPGLFFKAFNEVNPPIVEGLVLPLPQVGGKLRGTIWIVAHDEQTKFDLEDVRLMTSLAEFTSSALVLTTLLRGEKQAREDADQEIARRTDALRQLSTRLMQLQDDEHRRLARNLHDSVGQHLVALTMNLTLMEGAGGQRLSSLIFESKELLDQCMLETRTMSHLLHPPLLDEAGLASAAQNYVEEFSRRSGMPVQCDIPEDFERLSSAIETALFRVLQESLTNIHRHSGTPNAFVALDSDAETVTLTVRDYGKGLSESVLEGLRSGGKTLGVGLTGMRERIRELSGTIEFESTSAGTTVTATVPISPPQ
jgi:signal transduction histidine kinase